MRFDETISLGDRLNDAAGECIPEGLLVCLPWEFTEDLVSTEEFEKGGKLLRFCRSTHSRIGTLSHELLHYYHLTTTAVGLSILLVRNHLSDIGFQLLREAGDSFAGRPLLDDTIEPSFSSQSLAEEWRMFRKLDQLLLSPIPSAQGNFSLPIRLFWWRELIEARQLQPNSGPLPDLALLSTANPQRSRVSTTALNLRREVMTGLDLLEGYARTVEFENRWIHQANAEVLDFEFFISSFAGTYGIAQLEFWFYAGQVCDAPFRDKTPPTPRAFATLLSNLVLTLELSLMAPIHPALVKLWRTSPEWNFLDPVTRFYTIVKALASRQIHPIEFDTRRSPNYVKSLDRWSETLGWPLYSDSLDALFSYESPAHVSEYIQRRAKPLIERKRRRGIEIDLDELIYDLGSMDPPVVILTSAGCLGIGLEEVSDEHWKALMVFLKAEIATFAVRGKERTRLERLRPVLRPLDKQIHTLMNYIVEIVPSIKPFRQHFEDQFDFSSVG